MENERVAALCQQVIHCRKHLARDRAFRRWRTVSFVVMLLACALIVWASGTPVVRQALDPWSFPAGVVAILLIAFVSLPLRNAQYYRALARLSTSPQRNPQRAAVEDGDLVCQGPGVVSRIAISEIGDIVDTGSQLLIYLAPGDPITLTKAAFDHRAYDTFRDDLMAHWKAARVGTAPS